MSDPLDEELLRELDDDRFDESIAKAMEQDSRHAEVTRHMRELGERLGALHDGMVSHGMDPDSASEIVHGWMECAVFQRISRETGTLGY